jgi:ABC-type amino acid transport substrate-binding protein
VKTKLRLPFLGLLAALLVVALAAAGCGDDEESGETSGTAQGEELDTLEPGVLTVGSDIPYRPFEFGDAPDYEGFDVDIINAVADRAGLEVQIEKTPFATIFRNLAQGQFDAVISATTITAERDEVVDFSDPYFLANQSLVVAPGSDIQSVDDLSDTTVGVQIGTTGADYAENETEAAEVRPFDLGDQAFQALNAGQVDAVIIDFPVAQAAIDAGEDLEVAEQIDTDEVYGISVAPGSEDLLTAINDGLSQIKEDGTYEDIYREWFGEDPPPEILDPSGGEEGGAETEPAGDAGTGE